MAWSRLGNIAARARRLTKRPEEVGRLLRSLLLLKGRLSLHGRMRTKMVSNRKTQAHKLISFLTTLAAWLPG